MEDLMPIYEFQCEMCHHCFEKLMLAADDEQATCPKCCATEVKRLMSAARCIGSSEGKGCAPVGASSGFS
jgi:putative FmdB family regulatory protein